MWIYIYIVYIYIYIYRTSHLKFAHESSVSRHQNTRELPLKPTSNRRYQRKNTDLFNHGYIIIVYNIPFSLQRTVCNKNSTFKHIDWSNVSVAKPTTPATTVWLTRYVIAAGVDGDYSSCPQALLCDMTTRTAIAFNSSFDLLLVSKILVAKAQMYWCHVKIGINHGWVCVNLLLWCLAAGWYVDAITCLCFNLAADGQWCM